MPSFVVCRKYLSCRGLYTYLLENPEEVRRCELAKVYTKSWFQLRMSQADPKLLHYMDGRQGCKDLIADSSGFSVNAYVEWKHAKYGSINVRRFVKMHILRAGGGKIVVATGEEHDSPQRDAQAAARVYRDGYHVRHGRAGLQRQEELSRNQITDAIR